MTFGFLYQTNGGRDALLLVRDKYRHYRDAASEGGRRTVEQKDRLGSKEMEGLLERVFGIAGVDLGQLDKKICKEDEKAQGLDDAEE